MRTYIKGGYTTLDLATLLYADVAIAYAFNKAIMLRDGNSTYFVDTISFDSENETYTITKGGKTITITSTNVVTSQGEIQPQSGGTSLQYITVYCVYETYPLYFTMLVDDNTLETYLDLYNYLVRKGLVMTENITPQASAKGYSAIIGTLVAISVSTFDKDEYIQVSSNSNSDIQLFKESPNFSDFSITYLGQE